MTVIEFAEWILRSGYRPYRNTWITERQYEEESDPTGLTTIQLYSIFLEHELAGEDTGSEPQQEV